MEQKEKLIAELRAFVARWTKGSAQRTPEWYANMGSTVGGSEMAAILGISKYQTFNDVVLSKALLMSGRPRPFGGGPACNWGILMEEVITPCVELELCCPVVGDSICISQYEGHRNSPDGYLVAAMAIGDGGAVRLLTRRAPELRPGERKEYHIVLLEFKNPLTRKPDGGIHNMYLPQVLSGLMVSPMATYGVFVDSVIRKCSMAQLGPVPGYDVVYHRSDAGAYSGKPLRWGVIALYAPPDGEIGGFAWGRKAPCNTGGGYLPNDIGAESAHIFDYVVGLAARRELGVLVPSPTARSVKALCEAVPPTQNGWRLWGYIPWKLFESHYTVVHPQPDFADQVLPLIAEVLRRARAMAQEMTAKNSSEAGAAAGADQPLSVAEELGLDLDDLS